jgi:hypothetical protein
VSETAEASKVTREACSHDMLITNFCTDCHVSGSRLCPVTGVRSIEPFSSVVTELVSILIEDYFLGYS